MSDFIIVDGDKAEFQPSFPSAQVVVRPGEIQGSGKFSLMDKKVCVLGDEKTVSVPGCAYTAGPFSTPGIGTLKIDFLSSDQIANKTDSAGRPMILKGSTFHAKFEVQTPASRRVPLTPNTPPQVQLDVTTQYFGTGRFITTNTKLTAT